MNQKNLFLNIKYDLPASVVVFLVALPLCLGVALASGAPLLAGVISGIIGGVVVGILSQSHTSVSGPAAGLAAVVLSSITLLGSFEIFLLAVVIAGLMQVALGISKAGFIANYIPSNVIKGLLAAIGLILILKQIPHAFGIDKNVENDFKFFQNDGENTLSELLTIVNYFSWGSVIITILSLLILIYWEKIPIKAIKIIPVSLFVVVMGVVCNAFFKSYFPAYTIESTHLVNIPKFEGINSIITFPNFAGLGNIQVWIVAFTIAIVASLETLLNLEAVENIDPHKRQASPNRELLAQGIGNIISGLIGGIPITSVIVRSSVNINAGAVSKASAILHGVFLLVSLILLSSILNLIPLASLASILILTGYKLTKISLFRDIYKKGLNQFIPFVVTIVAIVFTDLLIGVLIGLAVSIFYLLKSNFKNPFVLQKETLHIDEIVRMELPNQVSFLNKASIKDTLWSIPNNTKMIIDATNADFIDNDILEIINDFKQTISVEKEIKLNILGLKEQYQLDDHIQFVNVLDKETQQKMQPDEIVEILKKGNSRFVAGSSNEKYLKHQVNATSFGQNPLAIILSCIDSRTTTEHIFDLGLGDIFSVRIAGNILNEDILGSMEFATKIVDVKLVVVLGHTKCGAIIGACNDVKLNHLTTLLNKVKPAIDSENVTFENRNGSNEHFVNNVTLLNVHLTMARIREESSIIAELERKGVIKIVGGLYHVETGEVNFFE
ncbi:MAG: SulP family inorganic anion transporter [Chitinophagaceae bacterium]|nr:SulP family inorganic anion transporter [Chitinophagaceae bacterium]